MTIAANRPLKSARSRALLGRALSWWLDELRGCRADAQRWLVARGGHGMTIEAGERYWLVRQGQHPVGQIDVASADAALQLRHVAASGARRGIIVEIPPERVLAKVVAFPAGAKAQLDRIVGFEIARHFPFPADRVYFQHRVAGAAADGGIAVEIVAVPREIVDDICLAAAASGLRPVAVAVPGASDIKPLFLPRSAIVAGPRTITATTRKFTVAAVAAALIALVSWPLAQQAALARLDNEIAALKPRAETALRAEDAGRRDAERSAAIAALRGGRPPLVAALDALSRDVPDGSWLLSLSISGRDVVLDGLSPSAAGVALALEKSGDAGGITFRSPITREPSGLEHFQLGASLGGSYAGPQTAPSLDVKP
ncbi:MAG: hypothetical protein JO258_19210 [Alphaproteobacteria bacterium]|nr:hypothetical protein [Alphaproteobacteria bacterium]